MNDATIDWRVKRKIFSHKAQIFFLGNSALSSSTKCALRVNSVGLKCPFLVPPASIPCVKTSVTMRLLCVICGLLASLCVCVCECGKPDCFPVPVRDLELRAGVVFEGVLEESPDYKTEPFGVDEVTRVTREPVTGAALHQSMIRVHRVWDIKTGGLRKDAVVLLIWSPEDKCFLMKAGTRYVFFTEPTGDASVLRALSPPMQSKRAVRQDITDALCQTCGKHLI